MADLLPRKATHAAIRLAGRLLAQDCNRPAFWPIASQLATGQAMLHCMDDFDVVGSEEQDREITALAVADPLVWLEVAERGDLDGRHFIPNVLWHHGIGGSPGEAWIGYLLQSIAAMSEARRFDEALVHPELVGLSRVVTELPDGSARLLAVMDRW